MLEWMLLLLMLAGSGFGAGFMAREFWNPWEPKQLPAPKDPMEDRLFPYFFLLDTDPDSWEVNEGSAFSGWLRLNHPSGKEIGVYKVDQDVTTDTFSEQKLTEDEKVKLRNAVYKLQSMRTVERIIG